MPLSRAQLNWGVDVLNPIQPVGPDMQPGL